MALTDINFQEGDIQNSILELPTNTLYSPEDIIVEANGAQCMSELPGGDIFIVND